MIATLIKNWWLLAIGGVLEAITSVVYFNHAAHGFNASKDIVFLGRLAIAAGACTIAAGVWASANREGWLLALNGLALSALGLILDGIAGFQISFRTIAFLMILMAISIGVFELITARTLRLRGNVADAWFLRFAGAASVGFALAFFALGFGLIRLKPGSHPDLLWLGAYFAFSAICMFAPGFRSNSLRADINRQGNHPFTPSTKANRATTSTQYTASKSLTLESVEATPLRAKPHPGLANAPDDDRGTRFLVAPSRANKLGAQR